MLQTGVIPNFDLLDLMLNLGVKGKNNKENAIAILKMCQN